MLQNDLCSIHSTSCNQRLQLLQWLCNVWEATQASSGSAHSSGGSTLPTPCMLCSTATRPLHCTFPRCFSAELRCLALSMHTLLCSSGSICVAAQQNTQLASVGSIPSVSSTPKSCCLHALKIPASMRQEQRVMCCTPCYMQLRIQGTAAA